MLTAEQARELSKGSLTEHLDHLDSLIRKSLMEQSSTTEIFIYDKQYYQLISTDSLGLQSALVDLGYKVSTSTFYDDGSWVKISWE